LSGARASVEREPFLSRREVQRRGATPRRAALRAEGAEGLEGGPRGGAPPSSAPPGRAGGDVPQPAQTLPSTLMGGHTGESQSKQPHLGIAVLQRLTRTGVAQVNLSRNRPRARWKTPRARRVRQRLHQHGQRALHRCLQRSHTLVPHVPGRLQLPPRCPVSAAMALEKPLEKALEKPLEKALERFPASAARARGAVSAQWPRPPPPLT
jgi:hypothetical protein